MKVIIHVHQQKLKRNEPAVIVKTYKGSAHFKHVEIKGPSTLIQLDKPDACGARCILVTNDRVEGYDEHNEKTLFN